MTQTPHHPSVPPSGAGSSPSATDPGIYNLSFMSVALRPDLSRTVAEIFLQEQSWTATRSRIRTSNALQCQNPNTAERLERELRHRLETLSVPQLTLLATAPSEDRAAICWLATMKHSRFAFEFAAEVLRDKLALHDTVLRYSDFEAYLELKSLVHPELAGLRPNTTNRVRKTLLGMLIEAGLLGAVRRTASSSVLASIRRPFISPAVLEAIVTDNPAWLAGFLVPDDELGGYRWHRP